MRGKGWGPAVEIAPECYSFTSAPLAKSLELTEHVHRRERKAEEARRTKERLKQEERKHKEEPDVRTQR